MSAFVESACAFAAALPEARTALLLCEDRARFALALVALSLRGATALLPPSHAPQALAAIAASRRPTFALVDRRGSMSGIDEIEVPSCEASGVAGIPPIADDHVAAVVYTSGTTGEPQPHDKSWRSLREGALALRDRIGFERGSTIAGAVPPQHMWGLEATVMLALHGEGRIDPPTPLLPHDIAARLGEVREPRWLVVTPLHVRSLVRSGVHLPPLAGALTATSSLDAESAAAFERACGAPLIEIYGSSETGAIATRRAACEQRFTPLQRVTVRSTDAGLDVSGGHVGRAALADRADVEADGSFLLAGRDADLVKVGGKRGSLAMITHALRAIPGVLDAEVVLGDADGLSPRIAALVVAPGLDRERILAALRERIDPVFLPRPLHFVDTLPRNALGKIAAAAIAQRLRELDAL